MLALRVNSIPSHFLANLAAAWFLTCYENTAGSLKLQVQAHSMLPCFMILGYCEAGKKYLHRSGFW